MSEKKVYGIVGDGRMANHFCHYLRLSGVSYISWSRSQDQKVDPFAKLRSCQRVLLLIGDSAIFQFLEQNPLLRSLPLAHFSGSLVLAGVPSYHPLMSFSQKLYSLEDYRKIPFVYEQDQPTFADVFPDLPNPSFALDATKKPLYHALCVLSGNFTVLLWQKVFREFTQRLGLDSKILLPYLQKVCQNLAVDWQNALSGPLGRGDKQTIAKNLEALQGDAFEDVYRSFVRSVEKGGK